MLRKKVSVICIVIAVLCFLFAVEISCSDVPDAMTGTKINSESNPETSSEMRISGPSELIILYVVNEVAGPSQLLTDSKVSISITDEQSTMENGSTVPALPVPVRPGWRFDGWYMNEGNEDEQLVTEGMTLCLDEQNLVLTAHWWTSDKIQLHYDLNNTAGTTQMLTDSKAEITETEEQKTMENGGALPTLPVPSRTGWKFEGWYKGNETKVTAGEELFDEDGVLTLTAYWSQVKYHYQIVGGANDYAYIGLASGCTNSGDYYYGQVITVKIGITKSGKSFNYYGGLGGVTLLDGYTIYSNPCKFYMPARTCKPYVFLK